MSVQLASGSEQALVLGDAITQTLVSFAHPEWRRWVRHWSLGLLRLLGAIDN
jgi:hypothetical protein